MEVTVITSPKMKPLPPGASPPLWSVMIPTYNCAKFLGQAIESVLAQDLGPSMMHIEVVDDASTSDCPKAIVEQKERGRVNFFRRDQNGGVTENLNTCIERSRGDLVHILHGDDYVLPGFYSRLTYLAKEYPEAAFLGARAFYVDEDGIILAVSERISGLEQVSRDPEPFFYRTPVQTPGIVLRRSFYEKHGGFMPTLIHTADREMWARAIKSAGGIMLSDVLACYRVFGANHSGRIARTGENVLDIKRLNRMFDEVHKDFDAARAQSHIAAIAFNQYERFAAEGDSEAARNNLRLWKREAPISMRLRKTIGQAARRLGIARRH